MTDPRSHSNADDALPRCRSVLMVGTHLATMGGISTVLRGYQEAGLLDRPNFRFVPTHRDGPPWVKAWAAIKAWLQVTVYLIQMDAPVMHVHLSSRASFWRKSVLCLTARAFHRPYLLHMHGSEFMRFYERESGPTAQRFIQRIFRNAALVLALSEEWRQNLLRICPTASIEVLPNAVTLPAVSPLAADRDATRPKILFLGRLGARKGVFELLEAFARIAPRFPSASLICAGDGAVQEVRARAAALGIGDRVDCPGWIDSAKTPALLAAASIFALPSHAEGLPMALLEAMSWQLPVIATPVGGIPQLIEQRRNGLLVTPANVDELSQALAQLLSSPTLRGELGHAARLTIERNYSLDACIAHLAQIYACFGIPTADSI